MPIADITIGSPPPSHLEFHVTMPQHVEEYVGGNGYVHSDDFMFQELVRTSDIAIYDTVEKVLGEELAVEFKSSGWGQLISAAYLLEQTADQLKISKVFKEIIEQNLDNAILQASQKINPCATFNVRGFTKAIIMQPTHPTHPRTYLSWKPIAAPQVVDQLNTLVTETQPELTLYHGAILLLVKPEGEASIFNKIWKSDFSFQLEKHGYTGLKQPHTPPHLTLVDTDQIQKIKDYFADQKDFDAFMKLTLQEINTELQQEKNFITFTELCYTFSFEFPTFTDVVVANVRSECVDSAMKKFSEKVRNEFLIEVTSKPVENFHLTLAGKFREPTPFLKDKDIEWIIDQTGKYAPLFQSYWAELNKRLE